MKEDIIKKFGFKAGVLSTITVFLVVILLMNWNVSTNVENSITRSWKEVHLPHVGENSPAGGATTVITAGIAKDGVTWTSNLSYGTDTWHTTDTNNTHAGDNVPYGTNVYVFAKIFINASDLINTDGVDNFDLTWFNAWFNCTDLSVSSLEMTEANISGVTECDTNGIFVHVYAGPYTWNRGQNVTGMQIKFKLFK